MHPGSVRSGHYIAYRKGPQGNWYLINDNQTQYKYVNEKTVTKEEGYFLWYHRTDDNCYISLDDKIVSDDDSEENPCSTVGSFEFVDERAHRVNFF